MDRSDKKNMPRAKILFRSEKVSLLLLPVLIFSFFAQPLLGAGDPKPATILVSELNMRSGPGDHNPPIAILRKGTRVLVLSYEGEWVRILFEDQTGFIMNRESYLSIDEPGAVPAGDVMPPRLPDSATDDLNRELEISKEKADSFSQAETAIINALDDTERALDRARKKVAGLSHRA